MKFRNILKTVALALAFTTLIVNAQAQEDPKVKELEAQVEAVGERVGAVETAIAKMNKLKITGYVQPQWVWNNIDSLGNQFTTRSYFQVRRGRVKFTYTMPIEGTTGSRECPTRQCSKRADPVKRRGLKENSQLPGGYCD